MNWGMRGAVIKAAGANSPFYSKIVCFRQKKNYDKDLSCVSKTQNVRMHVLKKNKYRFSKIILIRKRLSD